MKPTLGKAVHDTDDVTRRRFIGSSAALAASAPWFSGCGSGDRPAPASRPNILMIVSDDQGYGDLSCYGNPVLQTPHLDQLFAESTRLTNYCVSPLCAPTRAALMTGRHEYFSGVYDTYGGRAMLREEAVVLPALLQETGYRTGIFNKWHLGGNYPSRPGDKGFEHVCSVNILPELRSRVTVAGERREVDLFHDDANTDEAIRFITDEQERPFFAQVASTLPHDQRQPMAPPSYVQPFLDAGLSEGDAAVYGMIANLDHNVGRLLGALTDAGIADNTVVIFFPDNGPLRDSADLATPYERDVVREFNYSERFNMGLRGGKTLVYEGGIRVPCFVRWPQQVQAGRDMPALSAHVDWLPTLLDIAGAQPPQDLPLDGRSLAPLLTAKQEGWSDERTLIFQSHRVEVPEPWFNACVRGERFKLVNGDALYDLAADPGEQQNVAEQHPDTMAQYTRIYADWYERASRENDGFEPSYAVVGSEAQTSTSHALGQKHSKGWRLKVVQAGAYELTVQGVRADMFGDEGALVFRFGDELCRLDVSSGVDQMTGSISLDERVDYLTVEPENLVEEGTILRGILKDLGFQRVVLQAPSV